MLMTQIDDFGCRFNINKLYMLISSDIFDYMQKCAAYDLPPIYHVYQNRTHT